MANFGEFHKLELGIHEMQMLETGLEAVQQTQGSWAFLANFNDPGGFMFAPLCNVHERLNELLNVLYPGHSGASYGWTMRSLEYIAKNGWDAYVDRIGIRVLQ
jgi:hypothetical protein